MFNLSFILSCLILTFSACLFNACSGVAAKRAQILNSIQSSTLPATNPAATNPAATNPAATNPAATNPENLNQTTTETQPTLDNPNNFNFFPYDLQLDTISYMNCETTHYPNIMAGAYFSKSGIRLSEYFLNQQQKLSQNNLSQLIESSTKKIAVPHLSIVHQFDFLISLNHTLTPFYLRLHRVINNLVNSKNTRINTFSNTPIHQSITLPKNTTASVAQHLNDKFLLLLSYIGGDSKTIHIEKNPEPGVDIYGRAYNMELEEKLPSRYILHNITETKLPADKNIKQNEWSCPQNLKFEIRRHPVKAYKAQNWYNFQRDAFQQNGINSVEDAIESDNPQLKIKPDEIICPQNTANQDELKQSAAYTVASKVLGSQWNINMEHSCISPKSKSKHCYMISTSNYLKNRLAINQPNTCNATSGGNYCPQYFSICIRKN